MKQFINKIITDILSIYYKKQLPSFDGNYYISPKPSYLSQFVRILPSSIKVKDLLTNKSDIKKYGAKDSKEFTFWAWRNCGIMCVKMIMEVKGKGKNNSIIDLTKEGIKFGGYITHLNGKFVDKGWFHHSLAALLNKYNINAKTKKWQTVDSVVNDILDNKLVILSVFLPGRSYIKEDGSFAAKKNAKYGGHLLLATGVKMNGKKIEGIYAHDPRGLKNYQKDSWIPINVFEEIFSNRTIVVS
ncbi:MAG: C39 family peptidase [Candidatus Pacebacteria bacterium]|nr:C39 family peptidase [Candidatus Paceibacterota bacterium]